MNKKEKILNYKKEIDPLIFELMQNNKSVKKHRFFVADFETTNAEYPEVYSWGILDEKLKYKDGIDIAEFMNFVFEIKQKFTSIFFQNGSKFDSKFILPILSKMDIPRYFSLPKLLNLEEQEFEFIEYFHKHFFDLHDIFDKKTKEICEEEKEYLVNFDLTKNNFKEFVAEWNFIKENFIIEKKELPVEWVELTDEMFKTISIQINWYSFTKIKNKTKRKIKKQITFKDANLLFTGALKNKGESLNEIFKTDLFSKIENENKYSVSKKYDSYEDFVNDKNEQFYLFKDNLILMIFLLKMDEVFSRKNWKLTAASTAYNNWKYGFFLEDKLKEYIASGLINEFPTKRGMVNYLYDRKFYTSKQIKDKIFKRIFPVDHEQIKDLYKWYKGGVSEGNVRYRGILLEGLKKIDVNSQHPASMIIGKMPWGELKNGDEKGYDFKLYQITTKSELHYTCIPWIQVLNKKVWSYPDVIPSGTTIYLNSYNIKQFKKYYKGKYSIQIMYSSKEIDGAIPFGPFLNSWYEIKTVNKYTNPAFTLIAKLMLNAFYGKWGTKRMKNTRFYGEDKWLDLNYEKEEEFNLLIAIATTTKSTMRLIEPLGHNGKVVAVQWDTDSLIYFRKFDKYLNIEMHPTNLGAWDVEADNMTGISRRSKQYYYEYDGKKSIAFASIFLKKEHKDSLNFKDFVFGRKISEQTRPKKFTSGIQIETYEKDLKPIWSYCKEDKNKGVWFNSEEEFKTGYEKQKEKIIKEIENYEWIK